jgi:hypothetical protein
LEKQQLEPAGSLPPICNVVDPYFVEYNGVVVNDGLAMNVR